MSSTPSMTNANGEVLLHVLVIEHDHGSNVDVFTDDDAARDGLVEFVDEYARDAELQLGRPLAGERDQRIADYFEAMGHENWEILICPLRGDVPTWLARALEATSTSRHQILERLRATPG